MDIPSLDPKQRLAIASAAVDAAARRRHGGRRQYPTGQTRAALYQAIIDFKTKHGGDSPTYEHLMSAVKLKSKSTVSYHLDQLELYGLIRRTTVGIDVVGAQWVMSTDMGEA